MDDVCGCTISSFVDRSVREWATEDVDTGVLSESVRGYRRYISRKVLFLFFCIILTFVVVGFSLTRGSYDIGFFETYGIIFDHITGNVDDVVKDRIICNLRLPRLVIGIIAGAGLAVCGAAMQGTMMNPLADPYTTGVSAGAGFGATLAIVLGIDLFAGQYGLVMNAFIFALIPTVFIMFIGFIRNAAPTTIIMAGISVMYIFNAATSLIKLWADPNALSALYRWTVGSLNNSGWEAVPVMGTATILGLIILQILSGKVNLLSAGDEAAKTMGVNTDRLRLLIMLIIALVTAAIVSYTGLIGFVGLIAPHICRLFIGSDNRFLFPTSAAFGMALMVSADLIGRELIPPAIIQVGIITAFMGGPILLWLIMRKTDGAVR